MERIMILAPLNSLNGLIGKILSPELNSTRLYWYTAFLKMVMPLVSVKSFLHEAIILAITIFEIMVQTSQFQNLRRCFLILRRLSILSIMKYNYINYIFIGPTELRLIGSDLAFQTENNIYYYYFIILFLLNAIAK